ncbi:MAG: aspartate-semialdehyde dehydrogenase [Alphaproteobacteria bacterium]|nr:aspartate-semialdehyde dehydrogenase [Alphaproteobacteria bacterium]
MPNFRPDGQRVAVVGATGAVGTEMVRVLHDRGYPVKELRLLASARSADRTLSTPYGDIRVQPFSLEATAGFDTVLLAVSGEFAKEWAPKIAAQGATVIDNSSAWRYDPAIPLVVPEINPSAAIGHKLIANPNCTTAVLVVVLYPLHRLFGLKRVIVSSYQATSGAGAEGMEELLEQTRVQLAGGTATSKVFQHPIPFNVIPHIDSFQPNGYTKEEMKVVWESRKIMGIPELSASCTAVRIPTLRVHSEAVTIEFEKPVTPEAARAALASAPGVKVVDDPARNLYPLPISATGKYDVEVGRIRQSLVFGDRGLDLFLAGDQLLKGAALNAVQIAECVLEHRKAA